MIGYVDNSFSEYEIPPFTSTQSYQFGGFVQDNWRITGKLTLNFGFRYDVEAPRTERYNQMRLLRSVGGVSDQRAGIESAGRHRVRRRERQPPERIQHLLGRTRAEVRLRVQRSETDSHSRGVMASITIHPILA